MMGRILIVMMLFFMTLYGAEKPLVFGVNPWTTHERLVKVYTPLIEYLSKNLNRPVELLISSDYNEMIEYLRSGKVDIASLSPKLYVEAKKEVKSLRYLATEKKRNLNNELVDHYFGMLVSLKSSGIKDLKDAKGKRLAFTDVHSTSGYLYPMILFKTMNIDPKTYFNHIFMMKKHTRVMEALLHGSIDIGATYDANVYRYNQKSNNAFTILHKTEPIPFNGVVVQERLAKKNKSALQQLFLNYNIDGSIGAMEEVMGFSDFGDEGYASVRRALKILQTHQRK